MNELEPLQWLASKTSAQNLFVIAVGTGILVQAAKVIGRRLPRAAGFEDWWILGGLLGTALGLWAVEFSAAGGVVGLLVGVMATGGHQYIANAWELVKPIGAPPAWCSAALGLPIGVVPAPVVRAKAPTPPSAEILPTPPSAEILPIGVVPAPAVLVQTVPAALGDIGTFTVRPQADPTAPPSP
jgi:hypothetical protein